MSFCSIFYRKMCLCSEWGRLVDTRRSRRLINGDIFALSHSPDINLIWQLSQLHQLSIIMGCHCVSCSLSDEHQPAETKNQRVKQRRVFAYSSFFSMTFFLSMFFISLSCSYVRFSSGNSHSHCPFYVKSHSDHLLVCCKHISSRL